MVTKTQKNTRKITAVFRSGPFSAFSYPFVATSPSRSLVRRRGEFQRALRTWYQAHARALPWRAAPSLYQTVVSEFMLQQTQVKTVLPYFARWLDTLPDFAALARAPAERVLKLWEGLGYYSRARNLHRLAQEIVRRPAAPRTSAEWRELPGIGPYTAAAITSISFDLPEACVDGNVVRILARLTADRTEFCNSARAAKAFSPLAQALMPATATGDHNQAMMELGATVCLRQNPLCAKCPVRGLCAAARLGTPGKFPRLTPKAIEQRTAVRVWCERNKALLLHRAPASARRFANMHELPLAQHLGLADDVAARGHLLSRRRRAITRFQITESIHTASAPRQRLGPNLAWVPFTQLDTITLSGPHRRWIQAILTESGAGPATAGPA